VQRCTKLRGGPDQPFAEVALDPVDCLIFVLGSRGLTVEQCGVCRIGWRKPGRRHRKLRRVVIASFGCRGIA
jgi:hypothetical protein